MQTISQADLALLGAYSPVHLHLYIGGKSIPAQIGAASMTAAVGTENLDCGNSVAASLQLEVVAEPVYWYLATRTNQAIATRDGKVLTAKLMWTNLVGVPIGITWDVDGETEYGLFYGRIEKTVITSGRAAITAQDELFWNGSRAFAEQKNYQSNAAASTVLAAIASGMGVALSSDTSTMASGVTISGGFSSCQDTLTYAQAAGYVAGILGGNAVINRSGELAVVRYAATAFETEPYAGSASAENQNYAPSGVSFTRTYITKTTYGDGTSSESEITKTYTAGDGSLEMENPLADQAAATRVYGLLSGVSSRKGTYSYPMGIQVEPGDVITVDSMDGNYPVAVVSQTLSFDGGVKSDVQSAGQLYPNGANGTFTDTYTSPNATRSIRAVRLLSAAEDEDNAEEAEALFVPGRTGPITQRIKALEAEVLKVKNLQADNAEITNANIQRLQAGEIDVDALFANDITATGTFNVNNGTYYLSQTTNGLRMGPSTEDILWMTYLYVEKTGIHMYSRQGVSIRSYGSLSLGSDASYIEAQSDIIPWTDGTKDLGSGSYRWANIYLANAPNVSSDRNYKEDIEPLNLDILDGLEPVSYRLKGHREKHYGLIAQDVERALEDAGEDTEDLGILTFARTDGGRHDYALRYGEFIPLLIDKCQRQQKQIDELERRLEALERREEYGDGP